jgi:hypothetical protein
MIPIPSTPTISIQSSEHRPSAPASPAKESPAASASGFNPFPISRDQVVALVRAQRLPDTPEVERAWAYYTKWQGAWQPGHAKPTPEERKQIEAFTNELLGHLGELAESEHFHPFDITPGFYTTLQIGSPEYKAHSQTPGTQMLKALALMGLCEHELDIPLGSQIAVPLLPRLMGRTPLDPAPYLLYARFSIDANQKESAWQSLKLGLYMEPNITQTDLEFATWVGATCVRNQWEKVQSMIRELAPTSKIADDVIEKARPWYEAKEFKTQIVPPNPGSR